MNLVFKINVFEVKEEITGSKQLYTSFLSKKCKNPKK